MTGDIKFPAETSAVISGNRSRLYYVDTDDNGYIKYYIQADGAENEDTKYDYEVRNVNTDSSSGSNKVTAATTRPALAAVSFTDQQGQKQVCCPSVRLVFKTSRPRLVITH